MADPNSSVLSFLDRSHRSTRSVIVVRSPLLDDGFWGVGACHSLVRVGTSKPLFVENAILEEANAGRSVHIRLFDEWAWFVIDRTIVFWKHMVEVGNGPALDVLSYYELKLPPTGLVHRVELIDVFLAESASEPSCMAVTPEGKVVLWPRISCGHLTIELNLELSGQECETLKPMWPAAGLLTTTSGNVIFLIPKNLTSLAGIEHRPLRAVEGLLSGMRRRLGAMIFGNGMEGRVQKMVRVSARPPRRKDPMRNVYVLVGALLKKWHTNPEPEGYDEMLYEINVDQMVRAAFAEHFELQQNDLCTWILDMIATVEGVVILAGCSRLVMNDDVIHLALGFLDCVDENVGPTEFDKFMMLPRTEPVGSDFENTLASYKLLLAGNDLAVFSPNFLFAMDVGDPTWTKKTAFETDADTLLGCGVTGPVNDPSTTFFFYSANYQSLKMLKNYCGAQESVVERRVENGTHLDMSFSSVSHRPERIMRHSRMLAESTMNESFMSQVPSECDGSVWDTTMNMSRPGKNQGSSRFAKNLRSIPPKLLVNMRASDDTAVQLKAAVIHFARGEEVMAREIVAKMLPMNNVRSWAGSLDAAVDQIVLRCSRDNILDDVPVQDPRWQRSHYGAGVGGVSSSMLVANQIKDKQKVHQIFLAFLHSTKLLGMLGTVTVDRRAVATRYLLGEDAEKLIVGDMLYENRKMLGRLLEDLLMVLVAGDDDLPGGTVATHDIFFRRISNIGSFFTKGLRLWQQKVSEFRTGDSSQSYVLLVSELTVMCLKAVWEYRQSMPDLYVCTSEEVDYSWEFQPWTSSPEFRTFMKNQIDLCLEESTRDLEVETAVRLDEYTKALIDFLLDGYRSQIETMPIGPRRKAVNDEFEKVRYELLGLLSKKEGSEQFALQKAVEFRDYNVICEDVFRGGSEEEWEKNYEAGLAYVEEFPDYDFPLHAFKWLMAKGFEGESINWALKTRTLDNALKEYPNLYWVYLVRANRHRRAANVTFMLAQNETRLAQRKFDLLNMTLLFLLTECKKSGLEETEQAILAEVDRELEVCAIHQRIPEDVLSMFEQEPFDQDGPPLKAQDILEYCVSPKNTKATPAMFMEAFRASKLVNVEDAGCGFRRYIWWSAVRRNEWKSAIEEPEAIRQTFVYKVAEELLTTASFSEDFRIHCYEELSKLATEVEIPGLDVPEQMRYSLGVACEVLAADFSIVREGEDGSENTVLT